MKYEFFAETSQQLLFSAFKSAKIHKTELYRTHSHAEHELGYIISGEGEYVLNGEHFTAKSGDLFFVRSNEQHCIPTIYSPELVSFNFHITSYYLWNICSEYINPNILHLMTNNKPIPHRFEGKGQLVNNIISLINEPRENRFLIRRLMLELIESIAQELAPYIKTTNSSSSALLHLDDIQTTISFMNENLHDDITLDDIAKKANLSRSHVSAVFKNITGVSPYEYLLLQRIERAVALLVYTDDTITDITYKCGFRSQVNFNRSFKSITGMTPSAYRKLKTQ